MVRHFPTFIVRAAQDWFVTIAKRKLGENPPWDELKSDFLRHYLGGSDKAVVREQIERTRQGDIEKAAVFIPRLLRLFDMVELRKPEEELVEAIRPKLRKEYQDKLAMYDIYTIERLNDLCLKVESDVEQAKPAASRLDRFERFVRS